MVDRDSNQMQARGPTVGKALPEQDSPEFKALSAGILRDNQHSAVNTLQATILASIARCRMLEREIAIRRDAVVEYSYDAERMRLGLLMENPRIDGRNEETRKRQEFMLLDETPEYQRSLEEVAEGRRALAYSEADLSAEERTLRLDMELLRLAVAQTQKAVV